MYLDGVFDRIKERLKITRDDYSGWDLAQEVSSPGFGLQVRDMRELARHIAARSVLERAGRLVGPIRRARKEKIEPMREPFRGELDAEETLENSLGSDFLHMEDWRVSIREEVRHQIVLMMDTSLSMAGRNLALAATAAAVLSLKMRSEDLSVVCFENNAAVISHLGEHVTPQELVTRILSQPASGFTNLEAALKTGRRELNRADCPQRTGLLITDGVSTCGGDPLPHAALFPRLFVLLTEDYRMDEELCRRMAKSARGDVLSVRGFDQLPARMLDLTRRILR